MNGYNKIPMKVIATNKKEFLKKFEDLGKFPDTIFISVNDNLPTTENTINVDFNSTISDIDSDSLITFLIKNKNKKYCYVYCETGISKSGTIAEFVNYFKKGNLISFMKTNPNIVIIKKISEKLKRKLHDYTI